MKEKKPSWLERYEARQREQVTHSTGITFTPGVPTEDGWYVCKSPWSYVTLLLRDGVYYHGDGIMNPEGLILSHAKLPEL